MTTSLLLPIDATSLARDDDALAERIVAAVGTKWAGHQINRVEFTRPARSMSQIGG